MKKILKSKFVRMFNWYFLRWFRGPCAVIDGLINTLTLGFYDPFLSLWAEGVFLDYSWEVADLINPSKKEYDAN